MTIASALASLKTIYFLTSLGPGGSGARVTARSGGSWESWRATEDLVARGGLRLWFGESYELRWDDRAVTGGLFQVCLVEGGSSGMSFSLSVFRDYKFFNGFPGEVAELLSRNESLR